MAGRERKYTAGKLNAAVERYFKSISRTAKVTEEVWTGELDSHGHKVTEAREVTNDLGEVMTRREYLIPPTVSGLCQYLGIHRSTWANYCDREKHPEFFDTTTHARGYMRAYLEEQLLTRKDVKGIIFDLQNNHGYAERKEIELGSRAAQAIGASISPEEREELLELLREEAGREEEHGADAGADGAGA